MAKVKSLKERIKKNKYKVGQIVYEINGDSTPAKIVSLMPSAGEIQWYNVEYKGKDGKKVKSHISENRLSTKKNTKKSWWNI